MLATVLAAAALLGAVGVADAQEPGVVYEPGSPSGKEYAIPLEEARRDATGGGGSGDNSTGAFGVGITRDGGPGAGSKGGGSASDGAGSGGAESEGSGAGAGGSQASEEGRASTSRRLQERLSDAESAGAPALWELAPLLLVLLPGLSLAGLLARREKQRPAI